MIDQTTPILDVIDLIATFLSVGLDLAVNLLDPAATAFGRIFAVISTLLQSIGFFAMPV